MTTITTHPHFPLGGVQGEFLTEYNGRQFRLDRSFVFGDGDHSTLVPAGFVTDFNSVPRLLWVWFPPWECPEAAVVHDFLYRNPGKMPRRAVDAVHRRVMEIQGESLPRRWTVWAGIRLGGWVAWNRYRSNPVRLR